MYIIKFLILSKLCFISIFSIQFSSWPRNDLSLTSSSSSSNGGGAAASENAVNTNFLEYSDLPLSSSSDSKDFEIEPPTAEEAEAQEKHAKIEAEKIKVINSKIETTNIIESSSLEGQRSSDEFNPETVFQDDESEEFHCSNFPNQTLIRPHFFSCNSPVRPPILVVHDSAVSNKTGDYQFPLDFSQTVRFFFDVTSFATRRYDNLRAEVYLYRRKTGWLGCGWMFLPTFGIIDNYDVCEDNLSCPIYPGRQVIEVSINPKIAFSGIFKMVHNKHTPYQLIIRLVNNRTPSEELMCVVYQSRIEF